MASRTSSSSATAARGGVAAWAVVAGVASVAAMPVAVYVTRFVSAYELRDVWIGLPVAALLGILAIVLARRARREASILLVRGAGGGLARLGRILGLVGICMAASTVVAFAVLGLLESVGSRG